MENDNSDVKRCIDDFVDYQQTVSALLTFAALVVHDGQSQLPNAYFGFGRRMRTSEQNAISAETDVTPDLVAQRSSDYGIVAEAKRSVPNDQKSWRPVLEQLRKYDDHLAGWWTPDEKVSRADCVLLLHQSRSRAFVRFVEKTLENDSQAFGPSSSIVEFGESQEREVFYHFRIEYGQVSDAELSRKLVDGVPIPLERVIDTFSNVQYYDGKPPLLLVLVNLWMDYFPSLREKESYDPEAKQWRIKVQLQDAVDEIQRAHGSGALESDGRSCRFPRTDAIREAFDWLKKHRLAEHLPDEKDAYVILHRRFNRDVREHFAKLLCRRKNPAQEDDPQLSLFPESQD